MEKTSLEEIKILADVEADKIFSKSLKSETMLLRRRYFTTGFISGYQVAQIIFLEQKKWRLEQEINKNKRK